MPRSTFTPRCGTSRELEGVVRLDEDRLRQVLADLVLVDVEGGHELDVADVVAAEVDVHEAGDEVAVLGIGVVEAALHEAARAVADAHDGDADLAVARTVAVLRCRAVRGSHEISSPCCRSRRRWLRRQTCRMRWKTVTTVRTAMPTRMATRPSTNPSPARAMPAMTRTSRSVRGARPTFGREADALRAGVRVADDERAGQRDHEGEHRQDRVRLRAQQPGADADVEDRLADAVERRVEEAAERRSRRPGLGRARRRRRRAASRR